MEWIMTIAAGVALGYFLVQFATKKFRLTADGGDAEEVRTEDAEAAPEARRLHKSATNKQIAGVCGGIAEYLNVDPTIVRLATVVLVLGWGSGLLAYVICALVLPQE